MSRRHPDLSRGAGNVAIDPDLTTAQLRTGLPSGFNPKIRTEDRNIHHGFPHLSGSPLQQEHRGLFAVNALDMRSRNGNRTRSNSGPLARNSKPTEMNNLSRDVRVHDSSK
jgi:hypothetical protein